MKNENYINIQGWMVNDLPIKGNELILYALIYGFSQDGETGFRGSIAYIMKALKLSNRGVIDLLDKLISKKLIEKEILANGNIYKAVKKVHTPCEESSQLTCEESSHNNNNTNNQNKCLGFSSEEPEYTEPPKETYKTKAKIYASLGMKYTPPPKSTAQDLAWNTEMLARYAKEKAMETLGINIFINKNKYSTHWTAIKRAAKNLGLEESKSLVNFYLNSEKCQKYGADPSTMFSDHSINLYQASKRKIKSYR